MITRIVTLLLAFFCLSDLNAGNDSGGGWNIVSQLSVENNVSISSILIEKIRENAAQTEDFTTESTTMKTLSTYKTIDGREGFVIQTADGLIYTITKSQ